MKCLWEFGGGFHRVQRNKDEMALQGEQRGVRGAKNMNC